MKNGFTLIELLAVIIVLAILALIATPIVKNIVDDSKESTILSSAELYLDGVNYVIQNEILNNGQMKDGTYYITSNGDLCNIELVDDKCPSDNVFKVESEGKRPNSGAVTILNEAVLSSFMNFDKYQIIKPEREKTTIIDNDKICTFISGSEKKIGSKYACQVKSGVIYIFHVLSYNDKDGNITKDILKAVTTNLIMDRNICEDGSLTDPNKKERCLVSWNNEMGTSSGPNTSMAYLHNATKDWTNISPLNYEYYDGGIIEFEDNEYCPSVGYESFISKNGVLTITGNKVTTIGTNEEPLRTRMPVYEAYLPIVEVSFYDKTNGYLYSYLNVRECYDANNNEVSCDVANHIYGGVHESGMRHIEGIDGYWTLGTHKIETCYANSVDYLGYVGDSTESRFGVRPVITVEL